jgi:ADP-heptose:LPS heptosyltransferase
VRVLVVRNDRIGDLVLALPAIEALKLAGHQVGAWVSEYAAPLLEHDDRVDTLLRGGGLQRGAFDAALLLWGNWGNAWQVYRAGIRQRLCASGRPFALLCNEFLDIRRSLALRSEADYNLDFVRALGIQVQNPLPRLRLAPEDHAEASAFLERLELGKPVMLHPGSGGSAQNWAPERYVELGRELRRRYGVTLLVTAGPGEEPLARELASALQCKALEQAMPLRSFAALVGQAALFVSASTGPMHLAAAGGAPTLSLFPPIRSMSPRRWGPLGNRHAVLSPKGLGQNMPMIKGFNYVQRISVDEAADAAGFLLKDVNA